MGSVLEAHTSLYILRKGDLAYYNQHLFSGLVKSTHTQSFNTDNWPFNGLPQCNTVCTLVDYNRYPTQWHNSYLFSAERITPLMCQAICCFLLLSFAFIHFQNSSNAAIVCWWNLPKDRNMDREQKAVFLTEHEMQETSFYITARHLQRLNLNLVSEERHIFQTTEPCVSWL